MISLYFCTGSATVEQAPLWFFRIFSPPLFLLLQAGEKCKNCEKEKCYTNTLSHYVLLDCYVNTRAWQSNYFNCWLLFKICVATVIWNVIQTVLYYFSSTE